MNPLVFGLPGSEQMARELASRLDGERGALTLRRFPDGEDYVRLDTPVANRSVLLVCTLDRPDGKIMPLVFAAGGAKDMGAAAVGLVAPYLAYMRQDKRFNPGEAITSRIFASLLSSRFDFLVTVDPHLHRYHSLADIYSVPAEVVHAAPAVAKWIKDNVTAPVLVGPDSESEQWVADVARQAQAPYLVLEKIRRGDRDVEVSIPDAARWRDRTPVLVDDIISTARTMIETVSHLRRTGMAAPVCVGVHAVFAGTAYDDLVQAGAAKVVTCNTIEHRSNAIDLVLDLATAASAVLRKHR